MSAHEQIVQAFARAAALVRRNGNHVYSIEVAPGKWEKVPGVTSVIGGLDKSRQLMIWASRLEREAGLVAAWDAYRDQLPSGLDEASFRAFYAQYIDQQYAHVKAKEEAANIGTDLHKLVEHRCKAMLGVEEEEPMVRDEAHYLFGAWEEWAEKSQFRPLLVELPVFSLRYRYAGTADVLGYVRGELVLIDWKTSNGFYCEMDLQSVAYRMALQEWGVVERSIDGLLLRLPKAANDPHPFEEKRVAASEDQKLFSVFLALLQIHPWRVEEDRKGYAAWKAKRKAA